MPRDQNMEITHVQPASFLISFLCHQRLNRLSSLGVDSCRTRARQGSAEERKGQAAWEQHSPVACLRIHHHLLLKYSQHADTSQHVGGTLLTIITTPHLQIQPRSSILHVPQTTKITTGSPIHTIPFRQQLAITEQHRSLSGGGRDPHLFTGQSCPKHHTSELDNTSPVKEPLALGYKCC